MEGLGRLFDLSTGFVPVDMNTAANTGKRVNLRDAQAVSIVLYKAAGTAGEDPVLTLQEHDAASGGTSQNLAAISKHYQKQEATLDGDEIWSEVTQTAAATLTLDGTSAEEEGIYVIPLNASALSDGFTHISLDVADVGAAAQLGCVLYILHDLVVQRDPESLVAPQ